MLEKTAKRLKRKERIRAKISGNTARPRLSVFRSISHIYVQLIDDEAGKTLAEASDLKLKKE
jgi:large subunit ribosomal protein L18